MNREDPLVETAILGREAEDFLATDVGRYLIARADLEAAEAMAALKTVWPWRTRRVRELQNTIRRTESIRGWLRDAIMDGAAAMKAIEQGDANG